MRLHKNHGDFLKVSQGGSANVDFAVTSGLYHHCEYERVKQKTEQCSKQSLNFLAFHVVASFDFGAPSGFIEKAKDKHDLIQIADAQGEFMNAIGSLSSTLRSNIRYNPFDDSWTAGSKTRAGLESSGRAAYKRRKASGSDSRKDLLSFFFSAKDPDTSQPIPENEIIAESISFVVGGSDTTSSTMTNLIDFIARYAGLQTRI